MKISEIQTEGKYLYARAEWKGVVVVEVKRNAGNTGWLIYFSPYTFPVQESDIPASGLFYQMDIGNMMSIAMDWDKMRKEHESIIHTDGS